MRCVGAGSAGVGPASGAALLAMTSTAAALPVLCSGARVSPAFTESETERGQAAAVQISDSRRLTELQSYRVSQGLLQLGSRQSSCTVPLCLTFPASTHRLLRICTVQSPDTSTTTAPAPTRPHRIVVSTAGIRTLTAAHTITCTASTDYADSRAHRPLPCRLTLGAPLPLRISLVPSTPLPHQPPSSPCRS